MKKTIGFAIFSAIVLFSLVLSLTTASAYQSDYEDIYYSKTTFSNYHYQNYNSPYIKDYNIRYYAPARKVVYYYEPIIYSPQKVRVYSREPQLVRVRMNPYEKRRIIYYYDSRYTLDYVYYKPAYYLEDYSYAKTAVKDTPYYQPFN